MIAVVQPHRYTRLAALFEQFCTCFNDADAVIVAHGLSGRRSADRGRRPRLRWCRGCAPTATARSIALDSPEQLAALVAGMAQPGDYVVCLGAGSITQWAYALPGELAALAS